MSCCPLLHSQLTSPLSMSPIKISLHLIDEMPQLNNKETCLNFLHFRNSLKAHRSKCDDKIGQRLNSITSPKDQCPKFAANLKKAHESRINNLKFCLNVLKEELDKEEPSQSKRILEKEVKAHMPHNFYFINLVGITWI